MNTIEKVIDDLNVAKCILCHPQMLTPDMCVKIGQAITSAIALLKEQENLKQKMWNSLYAEEDDLEEKFIGTEKHNDWFFVYRPWLQRGFEIAIQVIAEQEGM